MFAQLSTWIPLDSSCIMLGVTGDVYSTACVSVYHLQVSQDDVGNLQQCLCTRVRCRMNPKKGGLRRER
jgi:hypothetical protein